MRPVLPIASKCFLPGFAVTSYACAAIFVTLVFVRPEWLWNSYADIFIPAIAAVALVVLAAPFRALRPQGRAARIWWIAAIIPPVACMALEIGYRVKTWNGSGDGRVVMLKQNSPQELHLAFLGDPGRGSEIEYRIGEQLGKIHGEKPLDGICLLGDNLYSKQPYEEAVRDRIVEPLRPVYDAGIPVHAVLGSHDIDRGYSKHEMADPRFGMDGNRYFILRTADGLCTFFMIDSERIIYDPVQYRWFVRSLKDSTSIWNILLSYGPPEASEVAHGPDVDLARTTNRFFDEGDLILAVSGKNHIYERRARGDSPAAFITTGSSGKTVDPDFPEEPELKAHFTEDGAFATAVFSPEAISVRAFDSRGNDIDHVDILRGTDAHPPG